MSDVSVTFPRFRIERKRRSIYGPLTVLHASKSGGCVLRGQASWHTANGLMVTFRGWRVTWLFRRRRLLDVID